MRCSNRYIIVSKDFVEYIDIFFSYFFIYNCLLNFLAKYDGWYFGMINSDKVSRYISYPNARNHNDHSLDNKKKTLCILKMKFVLGQNCTIYRSYDIISDLLYYLFICFHFIFSFHSHISFVFCSVLFFLCLVTISRYACKIMNQDIYGETTPPKKQSKWLQKHSNFIVQIIPYFSK